MKPALSHALDALKRGDSLTLASVPDGFDALAVADLARGLSGGAGGPAVLVHVARDGQRQQALQNALQFIAPEIEVLVFPAWDCQPYDRVSPTRRHHGAAHDDAGAARPLALVGGAAAHPVHDHQRRRAARAAARPHRRRNVFGRAWQRGRSSTCSSAWLETNGFLRTGTVRDTGEYAVRGGIIDLYPPGLPNPVRLDFFGDTLESIRSFDPETQRTIGQLRSLDLVPMSEVQLTTESIRASGRAMSPPSARRTRDDRLYEAVSEGRRYAGLEHWLPLFHDRLDTLFDYVPGVPVVFDALVEDAAGERLAQIKDYYDAREGRAGARRSPALRPTSRCRRTRSTSAPRNGPSALRKSALARLTPFAVPGAERPHHRGLRGAAGPQFRRRAGRRGRERLRRRDPARPRSASGGAARSRRRMVGGLARASLPCAQDHGLAQTKPVARLADALAAQRPSAGRNLGPGGRVRGWRPRGHSEQDILGDRLVRPKRKAKRPQDFLAEVAALTPGDLVVHVDHGIGRFRAFRPSRRRARRTIAWSFITRAATACSCRWRTSSF